MHTLQCHGIYNHASEAPVLLLSNKYRVVGTKARGGSVNDSVSVF